MPKLTHEAYLVRVTSGSFVVEIDGGSRTITTTSIPSAAQHMDYESADMMTQDLRRRGFRECVVVDFLGQPVSADAIRTALALNKAPEEILPTTVKELIAIPVAEQKRRCRQSPAFAARYEKLSALPYDAVKVSR
jgi:hypothetical protein